MRGALSAAFIPEYTLLKRDDPAMADQLASLMLRTLLLVTGAITLIIEAALLGRLIFWPASPELGVSLRLIMLMLPMMPAVCLTAILGGMLQVHGRFGPPAGAPIILNLFQIAAGAAFFVGMTGGKLSTAYIVGLSAVLASLVQIGWSLWALHGLVRWTRVASGAQQCGKRVMSRFIPAMLGLGTLQLNTMLDTLIAMWPVWIGPTMLGFAVPLDAKSNAIISYTQALYQFPLGVFGIAVATAVFPLLSRSADRPGEFVEHIRRGLRLSLFIGLPASIGLYLVRHDLITTIYGGKAGFTADGLARSAAVLAGFAPAVWAYSLNHVLTRTFYARGDTVTPMRVAMAMVALNLTLNLSLVWSLREAGLAWATAISAVTQLVVLLVLCVRRLGTSPLNRPTIVAMARVGAASAVMAGVTIAILSAWPEQASWRESTGRLAACVVGGAAAYVAAAFALRLPEMRWLLSRGAKGGVDGVSLE